MDSIFLLDLASRKTAYLAVRQATLAGNVANVNTPGFKAKDLVKFTDVLSQTQAPARLHRSQPSTGAGHRRGRRRG